MGHTSLLGTVHRNKQQFAALCYRLQMERLSLAQLAARLRAVCDRCGLSLPAVGFPVFPLYRFARTEGRLRMTLLRSIRGAAGTRGDSFRCTLQQLDGSAVCLVLGGELDLVSVSTFRAHLSTAAHDADGLLFDLRDLRYVDASGINALLDAHRALAPSGRRIALVGPSPNIRRILSVLHLEELMPAFTNVDEALAYLRSHDGSEWPLAGA